MEPVKRENRGLALSLLATFARHEGLVWVMLTLRLTGTLRQLKVLNIVHTPSTIEVRFADMTRSIREILRVMDIGGAHPPPN